MDLFETYLDLNEKVKNAETKTEIDMLVNKINVLNPFVLQEVRAPLGWKGLKDVNLKPMMEEYKEILSFAITGFLKRIPNYNELENVYNLIQESKKIDKNVPSQTSPYLRKVNAALGKEIDFPQEILNIFAIENAHSLSGRRFYETTTQDFEGVVIRLENYLSKLLSPRENKKTNDKQEKIELNVTQVNQNNIHIDIDISIENTIQEIENDDDLTDDQMQEAISLLNELKELKNEKPKTKWEKCKKVFSWLGDKTYKFGKWFIPIISEILIIKAKG